MQFSMKLLVWLMFLPKRISLVATILKHVLWPQHQERLVVLIHHHQALHLIHYQKLSLHKKVLWLVFLMVYVWNVLFIQTWLLSLHLPLNRILVVINILLLINKRQFLLIMWVNLTMQPHLWHLMNFSLKQIKLDVTILKIAKSHQAMALIPAIFLIHKMCSVLLQKQI